MEIDKAAAEFAELYGEAYRRFYRRIPLDQHKLTSESIAVLQHLVDAGPLTMAEAAAHLGRSQSAMSEMVDRMERRGLVARLADQRDRRRTLVWLTDEGIAALDEAQKVLSDERLIEAFAVLTAEQRSDLIRSLRTLVDSPVHRWSNTNEEGEQG